MAIKALIFGVDDMFNELLKFYADALRRGDFELFGLAELDDDDVKIYPIRGGEQGRPFEF